jgi:alpha-beta hydrolase superfamily lysophospholipase
MKSKQYLETFRDGRKMFFNFWPTENASKGIIALVHGLGEHSGRYEHFANFYNKNGYDVMAVDTFGHGQTEGKKGHSNKMEDYLEQITILINEAKKHSSSKRVFLYGHSMGGSLVLNYLLRENPTLSGIIATAPAIQPGFKVPFLKIILGKFGRIVFPSLTQENGLELKYLSHDQAIIEAYKNDPLVHNLVSAQVGMGILEWGNWLEKNVSTADLPVLIMHGSEDKLTNYEASKAFANNFKGDVTFESWEGMYHEIHNEIGKERVLNYTLDWINSK